MAEQERRAKVTRDFPRLNLVAGSEVFVVADKGPDLYEVSFIEAKTGRVAGLVVVAEWLEADWLRK